MKKNNIKLLKEERAEKIEKLKEIQKRAEETPNDIQDVELEQAKALTAEIEKLDDVIEMLEEVKESLAKTREGKEEVIEDIQEGDPVGAEQRAEKIKQDEKSFANYLRGMVNGDLRADTNMTFTDNGAVIPQTIADRIIKKVYDISPILERSTKYTVKGNLVIPYYPADSNDISVAYATEFTDLTSSSGKFKSITLTGFLIGALTKVSRSLINNSEFDIVGFVVDHMAYEFSRFIEKELLNGTTSKITGLSTVSQVLTAGSNTAITADEVIKLKDTVKDAFQDNAVWIMSQSTRTALRLLKDTAGRYLLQDDITSPFGSTLLGKPVYVSDNMPDIANSKPVIYYGDMTGLAVKISEELEIQVLREKYATQHAVGVVGWMELDSKIEDEQKIAVLKMGAGA